MKSFPPFWRRGPSGLRFAICLLIVAMLGCVGPALRAAHAARATQVIPATVATGFPASLKVGVLARGWAPFENLQDGKLTGLSIDYLRLLTGPEVAIQTDVFPDMPSLLAAACAGRVDLIMSVARTPEREHCLSFTVPYLHVSTSVVTQRARSAAFNRAELARSRVAIESGFALEQSIRESLPRARIETFPDTTSALHAVATGDVDAYLGFTPSVDRYLSDDAFDGLDIAFVDDTRLDALRFAVPRAQKTLRDRLDLALAALPATDREMVQARWFGGRFALRSVAASQSLWLSRGEQAWLQALPPLTVGFDDRWAPFSYLDDTGRPVGIAADYLDYLSRTLGVTFRRVPLEDWPATLAEFQQGRLALLATSAGNDRRLAQAPHSSAYASYPLVAVGGEGAPAVARLADLAGRRVAVSAHVAGIPALAGMRDGAHLVVAPDLDAGLELVARGKADVFLGDAVSVDAALKARGDGALKIVGSTGIDDKIGFAVRADFAPLVPLIDRALRALPPAEQQRMQQRWLSEPVAGPHAWRVKVVRLLPFVIAIGVVLFVTLRAYALLQREVLRRRHTERELASQLNFRRTMMEIEHARADELARARDEAEAASRAKNDFLAMMSHEIRTPMNGVLGLLEVLERTRLDAGQREMLGLIEGSAATLLHILDDLLDYSKVEAGRLTLEQVPFDLRELADGAMALLAAKAHEKGLRLYVEVAADVAATVRGDGMRLQQILFNLLGNAIKFTSVGEVRLRIEAAGWEPGGAQRIEIRIEDTGIGIAPAAQARLFQPFIQAERSTTRRFGGTGLGLAICRRLIDLMQGEIELASAPGAGTCITLRLSLPVVAPRYEILPPAELCGVILLDDERAARSLTGFGAALGLDLRSVRMDDAPRDDAPIVRNEDIVFLQAGRARPLSATQSPRLVRVGSEPEPAGYRLEGDEIRISLNPVSWRGLRAACAAAGWTRLAGDVPSAPDEAGAAAGPDAATPALAMPSRDEALARGRLVLVAEDHPVNQVLIRHQLALLGFACDMAADGAEALDALKRTAYCGLITDCHMPVLSGYELAERWREHEAGRGGARLPILGITASTLPDELLRCRQAGMDECLVKPTRLAALRECLERWFGPATPTAAPSRNEAARVADAPREAWAPAVVVDANAAEPIAPLDLDRLIELWGDADAVRQLLTAFVAALRDDLQMLELLLDKPARPAMREWHHRVAGAIGVLDHAPLTAALEAWRSAVTKGPVDARRAASLAFIERCRTMLDGLQRQLAHWNGPWRKNDTLV